VAFEAGRSAEVSGSEELSRKGYKESQNRTSEAAVPGEWLKEFEVGRKPSTARLSNWTSAWPRESKERKTFMPDSCWRWVLFVSALCRIR
jgi:hypothetical protein